MPEYIKGLTGYSDGAGGTISYGHQFGNGGRTASTVVDPSRGYINYGTGNVTDTGTMKTQYFKDWLIRDSLIEVAKEQVFQKLSVLSNNLSLFLSLKKDYIELKVYILYLLLLTRQLMLR